MNELPPEVQKEFRPGPTPSSTTLKKLLHIDNFTIKPYIPNLCGVTDNIKIKLLLSTWLREKNIKTSDLNVFVLFLNELIKSWKHDEALEYILHCEREIREGKHSNQDNVALHSSTSASAYVSISSIIFILNQIKFKIRYC